MQLDSTGIIPARLRHVRHGLVGLLRMERKVAETAPISVRIQKYTKASTELNPGEKTVYSYISVSQFLWDRGPVIFFL